MAHVVKDLDDVMVKWVYEKAYLVSIDPETGEVTSLPISKKVAEFLIDHGMSSGD